jgi:replicative DNA helicase
MSIAEVMQQYFRGRQDYVAIQSPAGTFSPSTQHVSDELMQSHLNGEMCLGFYLLDTDSNCYCTCVDFDDHGKDSDWRTKAESVYYAVSQMGLRPLMEISNSGSGAHLWLFFDGPTPAWIPRAFWAGVSSKLDIPLPEVYPRQDVLKEGGLGNLVRYPLCPLGKSAFVDVEDDWSVIEPVSALGWCKRVSGPDLRLIAAQSGLPELKPLDKAIHTADLSGIVIPPRVQELLNRGHGLLWRRWNKDVSGMNDTSNSALAMAICVELVRGYVMDSEIKAALRYWCAQNDCEKGDRDSWIDKTLEKAYTFVLGRQDGSKSSIHVMTMKDAALNYCDRVEKGGKFWLPTGIKEVDHAIDGFGYGELTLIVARPSEGKTALALQFNDHVSTKLRVPSLFISEEMSQLMVGKRRLLAVSRFAERNWKEQITEVRKSVEEHYDGAAPSYIVESCGSIERVEEVVRQFVEIYNVEVVGVDYIQLLAGGTDEYQEITRVSKQLKKIALRHNVVMVGLCQMNRAILARENSEPRLSDLRGSGQLEQDADLIMFTHYPYLSDPTQDPSRYFIHFGKRRNGPMRSRKVELRFDTAHQTFRSIRSVA